MGLDQWLFKRVPEGDEFDEDGNLICNNDEVIIYWRKCNQIHGWFDRLFGGIDNCENYPVTIEQLEKLREDCQEVLKNHTTAETIMPVMYGMLFGEYDYDKWYFNQLECTIKDLDEFLEKDHTNEEFYYHAWW